MFQIFGKIKKYNDYNSTGVGLGLTYCKNVIHHMNGDIQCYSEPNKGTKFVFYIRAENHNENEGLSSPEQLKYE